MFRRVRFQQRLHGQIHSRLIKRVASCFNLADRQSQSLVEESMLQMRQGQLPAARRKVELECGRHLIQETYAEQHFQLDSLVRSPHANQIVVSSGT
jgi:hypothetical protein